MIASQPVVVISHFPSPYQVELFNEVEAQRPGWLFVYYLHRTASERRWAAAAMGHQHGFINASPEARDRVNSALFVVFNYYNDARVARLMRARAASGLPWCFWAEPPGYRYPTLARLVRFERLRPLRRSTQPIWGIGGWAVQAYQREFGPLHSYVNLPYYSNLSRFKAGQPALSDNQFTFLFSGSLIRRKGADLLARAFRDLAAQLPTVRLTIMGVGHLDVSLRRTLQPCAERVTFLGFKDWADLPEAYQKAHTLCVPSRHDGWGLVVPEGLAAGLPVIASDRTGAALDLVRPGGNGWLVEAGNVDSLSNAMRQAATQSEARWTQMSAEARSSVSDHSLTNGAGRFIRAVDSALAGEVVS